MPREMRPVWLPETRLEILGFVSVELDFSWYADELWSRLGLGSVFLLLVLALSWAIGRRTLKKALSPLSGLQQPLSELASGNMQVRALFWNGFGLRSAVQGIRKRIGRTG